MIPYIVHVSIIIAACFLFYKFLLQKETFFRLNRWILLTFIAVSFSLPFVSVPAKWSLRNTIVKAIPPAVSQKEKTGVRTIEPKTPLQNSSPGNSSVTPVKQEEPIAWTQWLYYLYISGVVIFGANLLFQVLMLLIQCYRSPVVKDGAFRIIEMSGNKAPCSFGNFIFINPSKYDWETYNQILQHEKIHCRQKHTIDIFLAEVVLILQWFNPFAWFYRKQVETNLEFLTDDSMIHDTTIEKSGYQLNLLKVAVPHLPLGITTNYNQSLLKKRIAMMNEKKSSLHTAWKYFFLLPLLIFIVCALNQPVVFAQKPSASNAKTNGDDEKEYGGIETEGTWFAKIKSDYIHFDFKSDKDGHNWSNSNSFPKSDFPSLPTQQKGDFKLTRDAGTINFNGKFDGDLGYGHYKFIPDESFKAFVKQQGIGSVNDNDMFAFFMVKLSKDYINMVQRNGFKDISKDDLIAMSALDVDERYIRFWKTMGYDHMSPDKLISSKAMGIDSAYIGDIEKAGYKNVSIDNLTAFKAQGIDGDYIRKIKKAKADKGDAGMPSPDDLISFKAMNISDEYVQSLKEVGYGDLPNNDLVAMKSLGIDGAFIKGFQAIGYKNLSSNAIISFKSLGITPEFIKGFEAIGYKNIDDDKITSLKSLGIDAAYIKGFQAIGYKDLSTDAIVSFKSLGVTPEFIKGFEAVGYKSLDEDKITSMKSLGIKPDFIKGFKNIGFKDLSLDEIVSVKSMGITPEYITSMRKKGFDSKDINKYIELKSSFHDVQ